ncbi:hypothetical protein [Castellaniella sp. S9]|uniref:hypothetical protein n=1 Tax=Castellaniella sp. S9 TaxID=2993652 RepID=UPI0022B43C09|nr:hypothetical protein [Castellaniella sp. S9]
MKISDLDPAFIARLENWGMYYRDQYRPAESATYRVCKELAAAQGQGWKDGYRESNPRPEINVDDAMIMERHWCMCAYRVSVQDRALIRAYWAENADPRRVCSALKIRFLSWESLLCEAVERFRQAVDILEYRGKIGPRQTEAALRGE